MTSNTTGKIGKKLKKRLFTIINIVLKIKIYLIFDVFDFLSMLVKFFREIFLKI